MKKAVLQPIVSPEKRLNAERERNRRALEKTSYPAEKIRLTNATTDKEAPWVLFKEIARAGADDHRQHPSRIGKRLVYLDGRNAVIA